MSLALFYRAVLICGFLILTVFEVRPAMANSDEKILTPDDIIMVPQDAIESDDPSRILEENDWVVQELLFDNGYLKPSEISRAALTSFNVFWYLSEVNNGGFAQFVHNLRWNVELNDSIIYGLVQMGARRHLDLFHEGVAIVNSLGEDGLAAFLRSKLSGDNAVRDRLNSINNRFFALNKSENLIAINAAWLKAQPGLRGFSIEDLRKEIERRLAAVPDRAERIARAKAGRSR